MSLQQQPEMPFSFGDGLGMTAGRQELTARSSAMSPQYGPRTLSERQTPSLITAGLVSGITPTFARRLFARRILDAAFFELVGDVVVRRKEGL